jgi:hypothetical protein
MVNIQDFEPGAQERRGAMLVQRYADPADGVHVPFEDSGIWGFAIPVNATVQGEPTHEVSLKLSGVAVRNYATDDSILSIVATELRQMAINADAAATLSDGRKLAELKPADLYGSAV